MMGPRPKTTAQAQQLVEMEMAFGFSMHGVVYDIKLHKLN